MRAFCHRKYQQFSGKVGLRLQFAVLLVTVQLAAHALTFTTVATAIDLDDRRDQLSLDLAGNFLTVLSVLSPESLVADADVLARLQSENPNFEVISELGQIAPLENTQVDVIIRENASPVWADRLEIFPLDDSVSWAGPPIQPFGLAVQLQSGDWLRYTPQTGILEDTLPYLFFSFTIAALAIPLAMVAVWAGAALVSPIERLADGVDAFSNDIQSAPIHEEGPLEVRRATAAFNRMQQRLRKLVEDRAQTLAAIGHDMRTPLTRLRLRLEGVDKGDAAPAIESDLFALERMIDDALRFMRAEGQQVHKVRTDLAVLCQTVCDEWTDQGHAVTVSRTTSQPMQCDPDIMIRVLNNTVGNAVTYAGAADIELSKTQDGGCEIRISDTGPGIPANQHAIVLEPFSRLQLVEAGGPGTVSGFGLGLAISRELMTRQGGHLELSQNTPQGLIVHLRLPA